jgi:hypothetical protein
VSRPVICLGTGGEGGHLLVADMHPANVGRAQGFGKAVQRIPDDAPDPLDARGHQQLGHLIGNALRHD